MRTTDGGYIDLNAPTEYDKWLRRGAQITCYTIRDLHAPICYNCLPRGLPVGYPPQVKDVPHDKRKELSDEALNTLLRS